MEVTGLKELKKLMKGDARDKFEFEEDTDVVDRATREIDLYGDVPGRKSLSSQTGEELESSSDDSELMEEDAYDMIYDGKPAVSLDGLWSDMIG